jgi:hypothetical protein
VQLRLRDICSREKEKLAPVVKSNMRRSSYWQGGDEGKQASKHTFGGDLNVEAMFLQEKILL